MTADFVKAAQNSIDAGFDGVLIQACNGYLLDEFLRSSANQRKDDYGGSAANRSRIVLEILEAVAKQVGGNRTGLKISPCNAYNDMKDDNPAETFTYLLNEI